MDVGELLSFKPNVQAKRDFDSVPDTEINNKKMRKGGGRFLDALIFDAAMEEKNKPTKRAARVQLHAGTAVSSNIKRSVNSFKTTVIQSEESSTSSMMSRSNDETEEERQLNLLELWEQKMQQNQSSEIEEYDDQKVKKLILAFEKKVFKNQEMRIKFPDSPEKFMESELDLNDVILEMKTLATMPEQFHYLVELRAISSMLSLLNHANADVSIALIDLLQELTDVDNLNENEDGAEVLTDALIEGQVAAMLVQNMERLDEQVKEEANGVHNSLAVIENILELKPDSAPVIAQQGLLNWILKRLKAKIPFNTNKLYCSEILSIILQGSDETRKHLGEIDGIDVVLQQLAAFKRHDPSNAEEVEYMENMFNCLCSALLLLLNRDKFLNGEGLQLMNLMLREKKLSRNSALKVLDHAMSGSDGSNNCAKFVDILGLRTLFPLFMKPPKKNKKVGAFTKDHEEHVVSIIASMLQNLKGSHRQRLIAKFSENDFAKVDRLMELHFKYYGRLQIVESKLEKERVTLAANGEDEEDIEQDFYMRRLDAGLFVLQQTDYIIVDISASGSPQTKQRILHILNIRGGSVKSIRTILREYAGSIADAANPTGNVLEQRIIALADKF